MPKFSIIILSYNTKEITYKCVHSLFLSLKDTASFESEIIIVDNASSDGSVEMLKKAQKEFQTVKISCEIIVNEENAGFPKGNNQGVARSHGEYILFLNSDVLVEKVDWDAILAYMDTQKEIGAYTLRVELPTGSIDPASHRGFPTLWNAFSYYSKLEKLTKPFPALNKWFGGYHLTYRSLDEIHEIDSPTGAFFLTRKSLFRDLHGFDETFFMYGEDIDLAYRIKQHGKKIIYDPRYTVVHLKYQSGLKTQTAETQNATRSHFYNAMKIFYQKHYAKDHSSVTNMLVSFFIDLKSKL